MRLVYSILCSRDASDDTFARPTHIFEAALSCHVAVPPSTDPSQKFPRSPWFVAYIHVIPSGCARFTYTLQRTTLSSVSAEDLFCGESILRRIRSAEDPFCRKRLKRRSRFRKLHSRERETRREPNQERERNVSRWEAGARLLRMHVADSTCSGIPAHHCRFELSARSYLVGWFGDTLVGWCRDRLLI